MASHLELVDGGDFGAVEGEEDAHTLVEVGAGADQPGELGEQRVERAVALGRHGQRHALEEAIAVAVEAHLVVDNKKKTTVDDDFQNPMEISLRTHLLCEMT